MNNQTTVRVMRAFAVHWLSKAETDTKRSLRKLVEFGCYFSGSVQIKKFFNEAHDIIKSSKSKYYVLSHNLIKSVDRDRLTEFSITLGYNGFVRGMKGINAGISDKVTSCALAGIIGNNKANPIINSEDLGKRISKMAITGTAIYFIFCDGAELSAEDFENVIKNYRNNAFFLFTDNGEVALKSSQMNVMPVINLQSDNFSAVCKELKDQKRLFGVYCRYDEQNADEIISSAFLDKVNEQNCMFLFLLEADGCSLECHEKINSFSFSEKRKPTNPIFISELFGDLDWLNSVSVKAEQ